MLRLSLLCLLLCLSTKTAFCAEDTLCAQLLHIRHFVFRAQWATAYNGFRRQLVPPYEMLITPDSIIAYLPFYGRVYRTLSPDELRFPAIHFTSRSFSYHATTKHRRQEILIRLDDNRDAISLEFSVSTSCWCTLWLRSAGRDPMMYEGKIEAAP